MKKIKLTMLSLFAALLMPVAALAVDDVANSLVGVQGYDLVSYHQKSGPVAGNGNNLVVHEGISYVFANAENKKAFEANPGKYLPQYGGYCAYGAAVNKKFVGDPKVWAVVGGKLYLNLDKKVQAIWDQDRAGKIKEADVNWPNIKNTPASELNKS